MWNEGQFLNKEEKMNEGGRDQWQTNNMRPVRTLTGTPNNARPVLKGFLKNRLKIEHTSDKV